jgi:hypothetical protein
MKARVIWDTSVNNPYRVEGTNSLFGRWHFAGRYETLEEATEIADKLVAKPLYVARS